MSAHQAEFPVATMCRVLGISASGYYAWRKRARSRRSQSNAALTKTVRTIHAESSRRGNGTRACSPGSTRSEIM